MNPFRHSLRKQKNVKDWYEDVVTTVLMKDPKLPNTSHTVPKTLHTLLPSAGNWMTFRERHNQLWLQNSVRVTTRKQF